MNLLIDVTYTGNENFWQESTLKNKIIRIDESKNIHNQIAEICKENDYVEFSYKNKPQGNVFIDTKEGEAKRIGYMYRCKSEIETSTGWKKAFFDVWVTLKKVTDSEIEKIN